MRVPRTKGAIVGALLVLLGAWVALIPFVGPAFHYSIGPTATWQWTAGRLWLNVLPGGLVVLAGLTMLGVAHRGVIGTGGWLAAMAGIWIVIGPEVSRVWHDGTSAAGAAYGGTNRQVLEVLGYSLLSGAIIAALGAFELGRSSLMTFEPAEARADQPPLMTAAPDSVPLGAPVATASMPVQPMPAQQMPAQPVPAQQVPVPAQQVPAQPVPAQQVPAQPVPVEQAPAAPAPMPPGQPVSAQPARTVTPVPPVPAPRNRVTEPEQPVGRDDIDLRDQPSSATGAPVADDTGQIRR